MRITQFSSTSIITDASKGQGVGWSDRRCQGLTSVVVATSIKALSTLCKTAKYCNSTQRNPIKALSTLAKWRTLHWAPMVPYPHQGKPPKVCKLQNALDLILFKRPPLHSVKCSQIPPNQLKCLLPHVTNPL